MGDTGHISRLICLPPHPFPLLVHIHAPIEFLLHLVEEIGAAVILAQFEVGIYAVAIFRLHIEQRVEEGGKFADGYLAVIDTAHLCHTVEDFNEVGGFARSAQGSGGLHHLVMVVGSGLRIQWRHLARDMLLHLAHESKGFADIQVRNSVRILSV